MEICWIEFFIHLEGNANYIVNETCTWSRAVVWQPAEPFKRTLDCPSIGAYFSASPLINCSHHFTREVRLYQPLLATYRHLHFFLRFRIPQILERGVKRGVRLILELDFIAKYDGHPLRQKRTLLNRLIPTTQPDLVRSSH
jgi:hypothetical protein